MAYVSVVEWRDLDKSALFKAVEAGALPHPTHGGFDVEPWKEAILDLGRVGPRDEALFRAAAFYGAEIAAVRAYAVGTLAPGVSRPRALRMMAAIANQQYLTTRDLMLSRMRAALRQGPANIEGLAQTLIPMAAGQSMTADDATTALVDSIPVRLFEIWGRPDVLDAPEPRDPIGDGVMAFTLASAEHGYRNLWHHVLWTEHRLERGADGIYLDRPTDEELARRWLLWTLRQSNLAAWESYMDLGAAIEAGRALPPVEPVSGRTVIRLKRGRTGRRVFITGPADGRSKVQRSHVSERDMLDRVYTGLFMDEPLARLNPADLTCRELCRAWWIVEDLARLIVRDLGRPWFETDQGVGRFAIPLEREDLAQTLVQTLDIDAERARAIVAVFTADPVDTRRLFSKGVWATPLLPSPDDARLYLLVAPLLAGTPMRRIEAWMEQGGISDDRGVKGRGKPFEAHVRMHLAAIIKGNEAFNDVQVAPAALKRKGASEEIDLLVRVGDTVLVGEVKCFTAPSEPIQKANYLRHIAEAAGQARTKADWCGTHREAATVALGVSDSDQMARLVFTPMVVLNQSYGVGLSRDRTPIVDLHYLSLLLGAGSYQGETWFQRETGMTYEPVELYADQASFERNVKALLMTPPAIDRYLPVIGFRRFPFGLRNEGRVMIEAAELQLPGRRPGA